MEWIWFTLFAALMQAVRTAGQKHLTTSVSAIVATWARYGFGFPVALVYFFIILIFKYQPSTAETFTVMQKISNFGQIDFTDRFYGFVVLAALSQLGATLLLVKVLSMGNFAVGTTYAKTEGILAAVIGALVFSVPLSTFSWLAIVIGVSGIFFVSFKKSNVKGTALVLSRTAILGLLAGFAFAMTSLWLRSASLEAPTAPLLTAAYILLLSIGIQGLLCSFLVHWQNSDNWRQLTLHFKTTLFIGITGTLGSIGWYTAFSFQEAAIVKALGQIEFVFTIIITYVFFEQTITKLEWIGMSCVFASVFILLAEFSKI